MPVPFKVKAIYEYRSDEPDDLIFDNGQIITVTEDDDDDWYTGEYTNVNGQTVDGIFPRNFVEKYEPVVPSRPVRGPRRPPQAEAAPPPAAAAATATAPPPTSAPVVQDEPAPVSPTVASAVHEPPREVSEPPEPVVEERAVPPPQPKPEPAKKAPPPVAEKPTTSSFKDRIAAFNKPAAAPIAPFKPAAAGGAFIKKPFVAPPPSRNSYVPPPREPPPQKVYRREEDDADRPGEDQPAAQPPPPVVNAGPAPDDGDDQPRPTSLKERIALLQKQQAEQAQRQVDASKKKDKPKQRPAKPARTEAAESAEADPAVGEPSTQRDPDPSLARRYTDDSLAGAEPAQPRVSSDIASATAVAQPTPPSRELVSDTNDADDSGAADTEDQHDLSTEEEQPKSTTAPVRNLPPAPATAVAAAAAAAAVTATGSTEAEGGEDDDEGDDTEEEEEDPEVRRKRELRERMAKMSGGMGMMGMFGGGGGGGGSGAMPAARKPKLPKDDRAAPLVEQPVDQDTARAPPVPIMALPGMSNLKTMPRPDSDEESDPDTTARPTPMEQVAQTDDGPTDYISPKAPSRRSTDRAPPPVPSAARPEPPQSPGARPVPPPPPPTKAAGELPLAQNLDDDGDDDHVEEAVRAPAPPVPEPRPSQGSPSSAAPRAAPPPRPTDNKIGDTPRTVPPIPMSPTSPNARAPPPPPPGQPPSRRTTTDSIRRPPQDDSEEEVTEYDGDYDTDIASSVKHKAALKAHNRDSSIDEGALSDDGAEHLTSPQTRAPPPIPGAAPREVPPPPPPHQPAGAPPQAAPPGPQESVDVPRAAPPPVPPPQSPGAEDEYDPYRYTGSQQQGLPEMVAAIRRPTGLSESSDFYEASPQTTREMYASPVDRAPPPPPPHLERSAPAPPQPPSMHEPTSMSGALGMPERTRPSLELGRSSTVSRRSADVPRASHEQGFIAADIDLAPSSLWFTRENNPPPALQGRNDVLWEVESSTSTKRGGRTTITRDVYVLYQDYSQTTINATYDPAEPQHAAFEQMHQRPPMGPRKDQLENASESLGVQIAKSAEKAAGSTVGEGTAAEFVSSLIRPLNSALMPVGTRAYGALVYANLANASTQQFDEIRPGDIITFRNAKFAGHKGSLHQKYSQDVGYHVGVVMDWDGTKKKIRAWEQGLQEKSKKAKVRDESYRVADLKSGEVRVWRVMPRSYVNWGTS